ncbi:MAG: NAD-dependent epimerase/dehydratase family protein [Gammaproteobacteria bacterium]|nr:NAD-dependent epimerase/dehydratase family protein [Gammaproteobacteria bacterium]
MSDKIKKILITGGNGNLGRLVSEQLLNQQQGVVKFDIPGTEPATLRDNEVVVTGDIRDTDTLEKIIIEHRPDTIYHLASLLSGSSELDLSDAWDINATSSFELMKLALKHQVRQFFFASTIATYGAVNNDPMPEDYEQWPENMYGVTKVAVERLGIYFKVKHGLDFRCLRFPLVVSPFAPKTAVTAFPSHALRAAHDGDSFVFPVSENVGMSTIFLEDVVDSIVQFTSADRSNLSRHVYNLHAYYLSAGMIARAAVEHFPGFKYRYEPIDSVEGLINSWPDVMDDASARHDWGWNPGYDLTRSVDRMCGLLRQES